MPKPNRNRIVKELSEGNTAQKAIYPPGPYMCYNGYRAMVREINYHCNRP